MIAGALALIPFAGTALKFMRGSTWLLPVLAGIAAAALVAGVIAWDRARLNERFDAGAAAERALWQEAARATDAANLKRDLAERDRREQEAQEARDRLAEIVATKDKEIDGYEAMLEAEKRVAGRIGRDHIVRSCGVLGRWGARPC